MKVRGSFVDVLRRSSAFHPAQKCTYTIMHDNEDRIHVTRILQTRAFIRLLRSESFWKPTNANVYHCPLANPCIIPVTVISEAFEGGSVVIFARVVHAFGLHTGPTWVTSLLEFSLQPINNVPLLFHASRNVLVL